MVYTLCLCFNHNHKNLIQYSIQLWCILFLLYLCLTLPCIALPFLTLPCSIYLQRDTKDAQMSSEAAHTPSAAVCKQGSSDDGDSSGCDDDGTDSSLLWHPRQRSSSVGQLCQTPVQRETEQWSLQQTHSTRWKHVRHTDRQDRSSSCCHHWHCEYICKADEPKLAVLKRRYMMTLLEVYLICLNLSELN